MKEENLYQLLAYCKELKNKGYSHNRMTKELKKLKEKLSKEEE